MIEVQGLAGLVRHIGAVSATAKKLAAAVGAGVAVEAKTTVLAAASSEIPGRRLSRFNDGKGITLNAHFTVKAGEEPTAFLYPTPPGPWYLLERGGKEHLIGKRTRGRG